MKKIILLMVLISGLSLIYSQDATVDQVVNLIDSLAGKLGTEKVARMELLETVKTRMLTDNYLKKTAGLKIAGVFLFGAKEGGFMISGMKGEGIVVFDGSDDLSFEVTGVFGGATIGGSAFWAAGVIYGDIDVKTFDGKYSGSYSSGTAGKGSASNAIYVYPAKEDQKKPKKMLTLFYSGSGFSAGAGGITYTFTYKKTKD